MGEGVGDTVYGGEFWGGGGRGGGEVLPSGDIDVFAWTPSSHVFGNSARL